METETLYRTASWNPNSPTFDRSLPAPDKAEIIAAALAQARADREGTKGTKRTGKRQS